MASGSSLSSVAVTGARGALGRHVVRELRRRGIAVRGLCRGEAPPVAGVHWVRGALDDAGSLDALVDGADAILHLAYCPMEEEPPPGRSVAEHFAQTNLVGTVRLIERTPRTRLGQLLFASSLAVFGPNPQDLPGADRLPLDERFPVWPREFYGAHKAALEKLVVAAAGSWGLNTSVWRIGCVLGEYPDRDRDPLWTPLDEARRRGALRSRRGSYVIAADDVARILADALADATTAGRVFHVFDRWLDWNDLAAPLTDVLGRTIAVDCPAAPERAPGLQKPALEARTPHFTTAAVIRARLSSLAHDA